RHRAFTEELEVTDRGERHGAPRGSRPVPRLRREAGVAPFALDSLGALFAFSSGGAVRAVGARGPGRPSRSGGPGSTLRPRLAFEFFEHLRADLARGADQV